MYLLVAINNINWDEIKLFLYLILTIPASKQSSGLPAQAPHGQTCGIFAKGTTALWIFVGLFVCIVGIVIGLVFVLQHFRLLKSHGGVELIAPARAVTSDDSAVAIRLSDNRFSRLYVDESGKELPYSEFIKTKPLRCPLVRSRSDTK